MRTVLFTILAVVLFSGCQSDSRKTGSNTADSTDAAEVTSTEHQAPAAHRPISNLSPSETVITMMEAYLDKRLGEYYSYVASVDRKAKSLDSLQAEFAPNAADIVTDFLFSNTKLQVDSTDVLGDSAIVYTTSTAPPVALVFREGQIVERDLGPDTDMKTKLDILRERYRLSGAPREQNHSAFLLVREETGWRVIVGWADMAEALQGATDPPSGT